MSGSTRRGLPPKVKILATPLFLRVDVQSVNVAIGTGHAVCWRLFVEVLEERDRPKWSRSEARLAAGLRVSSSGRIERDAPSMLHVDFANKYVAGGALGRGCMQEEILFMLCPELIVARIIAEVISSSRLRAPTKFPRSTNRTKKYQSSIRYGLSKFQTG